MQSATLPANSNIKRVVYGALLACSITLTLFPGKWFLGIDLFAGSLFLILLVGRYQARAAFAGALATYSVASITGALDWVPALIHTAHIAWLCWYIRKQPQGLILGSALYWIAAGGPLLAAYYVWQNGRFDQVGIILLQIEWIVALICVLLADICLAYVPLGRKSSKQKAGVSGYYFSRMMIHLTLAVLLIPYMIYVTYTGYRGEAAISQSIKGHFHSQMQSARSYLDTISAEAITSLQLHSRLESTMISKWLEEIASETDSEFVILTADNRILAASSSDFPQAGEPFLWQAGSERIVQQETYWQWLPRGAFPHELERYLHAYLIQEAIQPSKRLKFVLIAPYAPYIKEHLASLEAKLSLLLNFSLLILLLNLLFQRVFFQPLSRLAAATTGIPSRLQNGTSIEWKKSGMVEIDSLVHNFQAVSAELREMFDHAHRLAYYDSLTGLKNRPSMQKELEKMFQSRKPSEQIAVIFFDLDRFKQVNDSLGHALGDQLLQVVAKRLSAMQSERVRLFRLSGDEFVMVVEGQEEITPEAAAESILKLIRQPISIEPHELRVTSSVGIALYPEHGQTADELMRQADSAMYSAKESGGDSYALYTDSLKAQITDRLWLENHLRSALENQEFVLHYQPIVDAGTGSIRGMEALIRWHHPERGMISPARFIPIAEQTGIIIPIGEWVLREACRQNKAWQNEGLENLHVAVNLSARQFHSPHLIRNICDILNETGMEPQYLELEITEGFIIHNTEYVRQVLRELEAMGVSVSIDDFGTGYSSLSQLQQFPVHAVKIDRSFVRNIGENTHNRSIVRAIIELAHGMGLKVVAEGIESEDERDFLIQHRCDRMQGYLLGRPCDAEQFGQLLRRLQKESKRRQIRGD
ncbi:EAL domain-containing protein [Xylanibacillus composti]|uniref:Diguanylate cyclase (GGDEF)-like protein n=1 Tax=Xylanibacillus composti TaxID=1572762 RepID=A0A8J4H466_9BACL|nr:EAL domain-containing protein [Xylanibacillus composti]MDT9725835.1 EAL domain-containing protein [Xylanibacillus composti]GIQ69211.1 hypothetical protein XYCOK13_20350 [Xylanibacillus composti]